MAQNVTNAPLQEGILQELQSRLQEPDWLQASRLAAWKRYEAMPMPGRSEERWRRTDLSALDMERVRFSSSARIGFELGFTPPEQAPKSWAEARDRMLKRGVAFGPLSSVLRENADRFAALAAGETNPPGGPDDATKFEVLARAIGADGYAVYVPRGVDVEIPLRARIVAAEEHLDGEATPPVPELETALESRNVAACVYPRSIIVAEAGSRVTVAEDFSAEEGVGPYFSSGLTEVYVGEGAEVTILSLQNWSESTWNFHSQRSYVEANGKIVTLNIHLGSAVTKANVEGALVGPNAQSQMLGVLFGDHDQHFDLYTLQDHQAGATTSNLLFKTALRDRAKSVYSGLIRVDEKVVGADAYQANRNLLLSDAAKADSQPMLEILNNDVRCTHGATMGPADEEQLFYLQSRGLPKPEAERMVVQGFFEEALDQVRDEDARAWVRDRIAERIGGAESQAEA
jgi:Fe-S cluster assembly protein SufD